MMYFIFDTIWGWLSVASMVVIGCVVVGYFVPSLRLAALAVAGAALTLAGVYAKGSRDRARLEAKRKEEAVAAARQKYDAIDKRPDTDKTVQDRLKQGTF